jgi:chemotaxis protein histidine kinase CheA
MSDEIVREFLVESAENLDLLDRELVRLEKDPCNRDTLASVFRTIHTIKGTYGFLGFTKLESVAHVGENLLSKLREGELALTLDITTALLQMVDAIRQMLASVAAVGNEGERNDQALIETLTRLLQSAAQGNHHMIMERRGTAVQLAINQVPPENSCRPAVDVLFRSVAATFSANTLAVVLTGMGSDGVLGWQVVRERGGRVYVQDEATSVVCGMPGQTAAAGWADNVFPIQSMAAEIDRHVRASRQAPAFPLRLVPSNSD